MLYRVRLDLAFKTPDRATQLKAAVQFLAAQAVTIQPGTSQQEKGFVTVERCYHDEAVPQACEEVFRAETP